MLNFIDTHAHLDDECFSECVFDSSFFINENVEVESVITASYDSLTIESAYNLSKNNAKIFCVLGIHPENCEQYNDTVKNSIIEKAKFKKVVGIGEIGLDYHYISSLPNEEQERIKKIQKYAFVEQLKLANQLKLPVVIHNRDSIGDCLNILKEYKDILKNGAIMHCFSESVEVFLQIKELGVKISVGGVVTFKNAKKLIEVINLCDISDFLLETDCPYLTPEPFRGKRKNEPKLIEFVVKKIAEIKKIDEETICKQTIENTKKIFKRLV